MLKCTQFETLSIVVELSFSCYIKCLHISVADCSARIVRLELSLQHRAVQSRALALTLLTGSAVALRGVN